jgi:predicted dehydrogenase
LSRLRVALLGCGGIAARHAGAVASLAEKMELVAAVGRDAERTKSFAEVHGGRPFIDLDKMIDAEAPDLVIATLPPYARHGEIEHVASRGVHLLVEKPIALNVAAGERMVAAAQAANVVAAIGFMYRFGSAVRRWRELDTGPAGLYVGGYYCNALHAHWCVPYPAARSWSRRSIRSTSFVISSASPTAFTRAMRTSSIGTSSATTSKTFRRSSSDMTMVASLP